MLDGQLFKRLTVVIVSAIVFLVAACTPQTQTGDAEAENLELQKLIVETETGLEMEDGSIISIQDYMEQYNLYGVSVSVYENYKLKWSKEYGIRDLESGIPVDSETVFSTASISKAFTATLAIVLEEKGLLDLDIPVNSYLKRWQLPDTEFTEKSPVTLRDLLSNTANTTVGGFDDYAVDMEIPTLVQILEGKEPAMNQPVVNEGEVGTAWRYSGGGYVLAMMAIEDYTNERFENLMTSHIFKPLGMEHSTFWQPGSDQFPENAAAAHNESGEIYPYKYPVTPELSASGLWSTAEELPLLLVDIQRALAGKESKVVSARAAEYITSQFLPDVPWGFPWALWRKWGNLKWFSFNGANTGTGAQFAATFEGGNSFAILGNGPNQIRVPFITMLAGQIVKTHGWAIDNTAETGDVAEK